MNALRIELDQTTEITAEKNELKVLVEEMTKEMEKQNIALQEKTIKINSLLNGTEKARMT